jgi:AmiR/NasT family two-component response regulator
VGQKRQIEINVGVSTEQKCAFLEQENELQSLGIRLTDFVEQRTKPDTFDICIVPSDEVKTSTSGIMSYIEQHDIPFIVSLTSTTPEVSIENTIHRAVGFIYGQPTVHQFALELELGLHLYRERKFNRRRVEHTETKINNNRVIGVATGLLMAKADMNSLEVFDTLKLFSRSNQVRISSVAEKIIAIHEEKQCTATTVIQDLTEWLNEMVSLNEMISSRRLST